MNLIIKQPNGSYREIEVDKNSTFTPKKGEQYFLDNSENSKYTLDLVNGEKSIQVVLGSDPKITLTFVGMADLINANAEGNKTALSIVFDDKGMSDLKETVLNPDFKSDNILKDLEDRFNDNLASNDKPDGILINDFGSLTNALAASAAGQEVVSDSSTTPSSTSDVPFLDLQDSERPTGFRTLRSAISIDDLGNTDTTAPDAPTVVLANDTGTNATDLITKDGTLRVTPNETGDTIEYSTDGTTWSTTAPTPIEGSNTVLVRELDQAGNQSTPASITFTYDTSAPIVDVKDISLTNDATPEITGTVDDATATVIVTINGTDYEAVNNGNGTWTLADNNVAELSDGTTTVTVKATDIAGNVGNGDGTVVVDTCSAPWKPFRGSGI